MAWQTAPGMIVIVGGFSLVGALFSGVDGLSNWIYKKVRFGLGHEEGPGPCLRVPSSTQQPAERPGWLVVFAGPCIGWVCESKLRPRFHRLIPVHP